ncbi:MAG: hypothetical protein V7K66_35005 [Nostoc sp.]
MSTLIATYLPTNGWQIASTESEKLEKYCASTGRPATDVIR